MKYVNGSSQRCTTPANMNLSSQKSVAKKLLMKTNGVWFACDKTWIILAVGPCDSLPNRRQIVWSLWVVVGWPSPCGLRTRDGVSQWDAVLLYLQDMHQVSRSKAPPVCEAELEETNFWYWLGTYWPWIFCSSTKTMRVLKSLKRVFPLIASGKESLAVCVSDVMLTAPPTAQGIIQTW